MYVASWTKVQTFHACTVTVGDYLAISDRDSYSAESGLHAFDGRPAMSKAAYAVKLATDGERCIPLALDAAVGLEAMIMSL